jgi:uncharacterized protein (DUF362 family)
MKNSIDRREFIKQSVAAGVLTAAGSLAFPSPLFGSRLASGINISVVNGTTYFDNTVKAVEMLGGIGKFVPKGSKVGLLINSPWDKPGTYTNPDVALAVLKMCREAGASEVHSIENASISYWKRSSGFVKHRSDVSLLKEADISKALLECDVLINIPIAKHHQGTNFSANLKNMMGACSGSTNRFFHQGSSKSGLLKYFKYYDDVEFLSQCIADVNLIRQPDLCVVDATEFITTNGPAGPGEMKKANKIVAGTNCVSVDAYCATLLGLQPFDVLMIRYAQQHGLGEINIAKLSIKEV